VCSHLALNIQIELLNHRLNDIWIKTKSRAGELALIVRGRQWIGQVRVEASRHRNSWSEGRVARLKDELRRIQGIVKNAVTATNTRLAVAGDIPGKPDSRSEIVLIGMVKRLSHF